MSTEENVPRWSWSSKQVQSGHFFAGGKLAGLEEFRIQKDELLAKFATMEEKLKEQEKEHDEVIYNMERKQVVDKDRQDYGFRNRFNQNEINLSFRFCFLFTTFVAPIRLSIDPLPTQDHPSFAASELTVATFLVSQVKKGDGHAS